MSEQKLVPELRFPGFEGDWDVAKLGEIAQFFKGKSISKDDIDANGKTPCIRYGELYTIYSEKIKDVLSKTNLPRDELVLSVEGDVIIPSSGESHVDIATASCVMLKGIALGGDLNIIRSSLNGVFLAYQLNNTKRRAIASLAQGNSVVHLYNSQLAHLSIEVPKSPEQQKIADFLSSVDAKLAKLGRKKTLLDDYKRGLMQQIFSQKLRFKQDDGSEFPEWETKTLKDLAHRRTKKNVGGSAKDVLTNSATRGIVRQQDYFDKDIANTENLEGYYIVQSGDYIYNPRISVHAPVGPIGKNHLGLGVMSPLYSVFSFYQDDDRFYEFYFKSSTWHRYMKTIANYGARHDRMNITTEDFLAMPLPVPNDVEQQKIADFLSSFDQKIDVVAKQIEQLDTFKKGLLKKLFVQV